uniref:Reverse transcriptase domain-containing protein n=1 Tax=Cannabis sativa TaxID=3483 RepID=A0A803QQ22_CANSA
MHVADQEHTSFQTDKGIYNYKVMPFGLKNAGATYQQMANKMFKNILGKNMEVYVDDTLVKSKTSMSHNEDLEEAFSIIKEYGMKLNLKKCTFRVLSGKFLGFVVSSCGIELNPEKIKGLLDMHSPRKHKDV